MRFSHDACDAPADRRGARHRYANRRRARQACNVAQDRRIERTIAQRFDRRVVARQLRQRRQSPVQPPGASGRLWPSDDSGCYPQPQCQLGDSYVLVGRRDEDVEKARKKARERKAVKPLKD